MSFFAARHGKSKKSKKHAKTKTKTKTQHPPFGVGPGWSRGQIPRTGMIKGRTM
jgi:hypothetical protein